MEPNTIHCPKCNSTQLHFDKKGFSGKKAVVGAVLTGGLGLLAGTIGSNKIMANCMSCGNAFSPVKESNIQEYTYSKTPVYDSLPSFETISVIEKTRQSQITLAIIFSITSLILIIILFFLMITRGMSFLSFILFLSISATSLIAYYYKVLLKG